MLTMEMLEDARTALQGIARRTPLDQAVTALLGTSVGVRHAAWNCTNRFAELGEDYQDIAKKALRQAGIDFF